MMKTVEAKALNEIEKQQKEAGIAFLGTIHLEVPEFNAVKNALEKQIQKKPDIEGDGYDENGELIYDTGYCPTCRHEFEVYYDATKYCPNCGQHLDWSETEKGGEEE